MKKRLCCICFVFVFTFLLSGCRFSVFSLFKGSNPKPTEESAQKTLCNFISKNYSSFTNCTFDSSTKSYYIGNNIFQTTGKLQDKGGWDHDIAGEIQYSPNNKEINVCYLSIDGKVYRDEAPSEESSASSASDYPDGLMYFSITCDEPRNILPNRTNESVPHLEPKQECRYIITIKNSGSLPVNYLTFKVEPSSPYIAVNVSQDANSQLIITEKSKKIWKVSEHILPGHSVSKTVSLAAVDPGEYSVKFYPYCGDPSLGMSYSGKDKVFFMNADFVVDGADSPQD